MSPCFFEICPICPTFKFGNMGERGIIFNDEKKLEKIKSG